MKNGFKTSEFWVALIVKILGILVLTGVLTPEQSEVLAEQSDVIAGAIDQIIGGVMISASTFGYSLSRGNAKRRENEKKPEKE